MPFCLTSEIYSFEVRNTQQRKAELNIILPRLINFDIKQKTAWNICFTIYPKSSIVDEVIRTIYIYFFFTINFYKHKKHKKIHINTRK